MTASVVPHVEPDELAPGRWQWTLYRGGAVLLGNDGKPFTGAGCWSEQQARSEGKAAAIRLAREGKR